VEGRQPAVDLLGEDHPMSTSRHGVRGLVVVGCLLLVGACSGGSPSSSPDSPSSSAASSTSSSSAASSAASPSAASPTPVPAAPKVSACYRLSTAELTRPTNASAPISCRARHNARTVYVGRLDTVVDGHSVAVDSRIAQRQLATTCPRKLASYLGGSATERDLSRFNVVWYSPTLQQSDAGAAWFRCDLVAFADASRLYDLPRKRPSLRHVLDRPGALGTYGLCGTAAPGARGFKRVICDRKHSWQAIDTLGIAGGKKYPGTAAVRRAGSSRCKDEARAKAPDTLKFQYGWEWPSAAQWARGQHYGYCWAPG
jgi:hypothetical protein